MVSMKSPLLRILCAFLCMGIYGNIHALTSNSKNDPCPVFSTLDPHLFLLTNDILKMTGDRPETIKSNRFGFSISPFWQCANYGEKPRNLGCDSQACNIDCSTGSCNTCNTTCAELGDMDGTWNLIALLYGKLPEEITGFTPTLEVARQQLFPNDQPGYISYPELITNGCGNISFPGTYRKKGLRWEADVRLIDGFGLKIQSGIASMGLTTKRTFTCECTLCCNTEEPVTYFSKKVNQYLLCKYQDIAQELCLDLNNFSDCYIEDVWVNLWWRKPFQLIESPDCPHFVIAIPFFEIGGAFATGKPKDTYKPFSLPFGNNGHHAIGATTGVDFNFVESIEVGGEFGLTHFFSRDIDCLHVPNSPYQSGVYPFTTCAKVSPGLNCHLGAKISCRHFLGCLSFFAQYLYVNHLADDIKVKDCDSAFCPSAMERFTPWKVQVGNVGFNYDISAHLSLGILWQIPISQCNTYKTTTVLCSLNGIF